MLGFAIVLVCTYRYNQLYPLGVTLLLALMVIFVVDIRSKAERFFASQGALYNSLATKTVRERVGERTSASRGMKSIA